MPHPRSPRRPLLAGLLLLLATVGFAIEANVRGLAEWRTPSFTLYSHDGSQARELLERATAVDWLLSQIMGPEAQSGTNPLHVLIVRESVWHRYLRPSDMFEADFLPAQFEDYVILVDRPNLVRLRRIVDHEFTHARLRRHLGGQIPLWFDEGVAKFVEGSMLLKDSVKLGLQIPYTGVRWIPMDRLLRVGRSDPEYLSFDTRSFHYQSWAFVHKAMLDGEFRNQVFAYLRALNDGADVDEAVQHAFGMSVAELDRGIASYARRRIFPALRIPVEWPAAPQLAGSRQLTELEGLALLLKVMLATGAHPEHLTEVLDAAEKLAAGTPQVWAMRLSVRLRDAAAAVDQVDALTGANEMHPLAARMAGVALFRRVHQQMPGDSLESRSHLATRAFELLLQSERTLPPDAEASWALGMLAAAHGREREFALQRLMQAQTALPRHADLAMTKVLLHESLGQREAMLVELENVGRFARSLPQRQWAISRIQSVAAQP
jgi:hypothetical protein